MKNSVNPDQLASTEPSWSRSTLFWKESICTELKIAMHIMHLSKRENISTCPRWESNLGSLDLQANNQGSRSVPIIYQEPVTHLKNEYGSVDSEQSRPLVKCVTKNSFSYFLTKIYVLGAQKNRFNETVLLSTQNLYSKWWERKYLELYAEIFC